MNFLEKYYPIIENFLAEQPINSKPHELYTPINYILNLPGKRLRPILTLMACDLFKGDTKLALKPTMAIEYFHNFSLIHDDIMDNAPLRRGNETVHVKYDQNTAILSGDALLIKSYELFSDLPTDTYKPAVELFTKTALELCQGQQYDVNFEKLDNVPYEQYLQMITGKTAVLCACALQIGAMVANAPQDEQDKIYNFGKHLGIAFQLKDDYLDLFGDEATIGKKKGGDVYENKKTILYILAQQKASDEQRKEIKHWYEIDSDSSEKVENIERLFKFLEVDKDCIELIENHNRIAKESLIRISVPDNDKKDLYELVEYLLNRDK